MSLRTLTYVVKMDTGDGKTKARDFRITLKTMEQDAKKAEAEIDNLAKTIGGKYSTNVKVSVDQTKTVANEIKNAAREVSKATGNYARLSAEYKHLTARTGKTAEQQEKMNALYRLGAGATLTQKKAILELVNAQQAQVAASNTEITASQRNLQRLTAEYRNATAMIGKTAEQQQKMNAIHRLGAEATLSEKKAVVQLVNAQQAQLKASSQNQISASKSEKNFQRLAAEYTHLTARTGKTAEQQEKMNALYRLGSDATLTQKKAILQLVSAQQAQVAASNATQKSFRGLRGQAQNIGWQFQDIAVQAQMGTNALVIFGQQGSQLASGFGPSGALVGAGIAVVSAILGVAFASDKSTDAIKETVVSVDQLSESFLTATESQKKYIKYQLASESGKLTAKINETRAALQKEKKTLKDLGVTTTWYGAVTKGTSDEIIEQQQVVKDLSFTFQDLKDQQDKLSKTRTSLGIDPSAADDAKKAIDDYKKRLVELGRSEREIQLLRAGSDETLKELINRYYDESDALKAVNDEKDRQKEIDSNNLKSNTSLVKGLRAKADVIGLTTSEQLIQNRATTLALLATQNATQAEKDSAIASYGKLIANAKYTESVQAKDKAEREYQQTIASEAKYTDSGKIKVLESQYKAERELLKGNQEALNELENQYTEDRLKISGTFWQKLAISSKDSLESFDDQVANSMDRFTAGFGEAVANSIFESDNLGDAMAGIFKDVGKNMVAFFAEWAAQKLMLWTLEQVIGTASQASAATTMTANASAMATMSAINAFSSTAAIPIVGPILAPAASAAALAITAPMAATVSSLAFAGAFDDGGKIPAGMSGIVSEYGDELVGGTMVYNGSPNSLNVTGREETARQTSGGINVGGVTINSNGNASAGAISRALVRALKKGGKSLDSEIYSSMSRGSRNKGKKFAA